MRADPDRAEELDEVNSSRYYEERPRIRQSSPPARSTPPPSRQSPITVGKTPPHPRSSSPSSQTPLLTATLNAPPQTYYAGINGNVRVKCPSDLSVTLTKKSKSEDSNFTDSPSKGLSNQSHPQAAFYSTLLQQLRHKAGEGSAQVQVVPMKIKKEKTSQKPLPFMCPACKKRFQRHIAMNAHFQNEHISPASPVGERSCKLCGGVSPSLAAVRLHLLTSHNIDLDNPSKCLVEDAGSFPSKYSLLEASLRSGPTSQEESEPSCSNIDMSETSRSCSPSQASPSPAHTPTSSESPERSLFPIKQDLLRHTAEDEDIQVEDLSLRRPSPSSPGLGKSVGPYSPAPNKSPRPESPCAKPIKRPRLRESSPSPTFSFQQSQSQSPPAAKFICSHCNIVYPNQTLYFLHKGFHSESNPWRCNGCGHQSADLYDFNTHLFSVAHQ